MSIINLNKGNCQHCYKCIRLCPLKSIAFKNNSVSVIKEECILCGTCVDCCPQNARFTRNDVDKVQELLSGNIPTYASLAPSWESYFEGTTFEQMSAALKGLGFAGVEETAIGAAETSREYARLMGEGTMSNIITTACPSVVMLIEQRFPSLILQLAPVMSPMMAHGKLMRQVYGDINVVFFGPCLAKMQEAEDALSGGQINHAMLFSALMAWLEGSPNASTVADDAPVGVTSPRARIYPKPTGILGTIDAADYRSYRQLAVDGPERCLEFFQWLIDSGETGLFVEANTCRGSCLGGPDMRMGGFTPFGGELQIDGAHRPWDDLPAPTAQLRQSYPRTFANRQPIYTAFTETEILGVLAKTGKVRPEQELNCGCCGYPTCRAKAEAVLQGKADVNMCLPFLREQAEQISATVLAHSPNGTIALDSEMNVIDINPRAAELYGRKGTESKGCLLPEFFGEDSFDTARETGQAVCKRGVVTTTGHVIEQTVIYIAESDTYVVFAKDITAEEEHQKQLEELRRGTVNVAQKVIDKQMRVAQEIASLLGETTAETKVALTNLQKSMSQEQ